MPQQVFKTLYHCTYSLQDHLVVVTKYRRKCLAGAMLAELREICERQLQLKEEQYIQQQSAPH